MLILKVRNSVKGGDILKFSFVIKVTKQTIKSVFGLAYQVLMPRKVPVHFGVSKKYVCRVLVHFSAHKKYVSCTLKCTPLALLTSIAISCALK